MSKCRIIKVCFLVVALLVACTNTLPVVQVPTNSSSYLNQDTPAKITTATSSTVPTTIIRTAPVTTTTSTAEIPTESGSTVTASTTPSLETGYHSLLLMEAYTSDTSEGKDSNPGLIIDISENREIELGTLNIPVAWSPSGNRLMLTSPDRLTLYLSDVDGTNPQKIMDVIVVREGASITGWWLSDQVILVQNWGGRTVFPSVYRYFIETKRLDGPYNDITIQAVSSDGTHWVQMNVMTGKIEIASLNNDSFSLSDLDPSIGFTAQMFADKSNQTIQFTPSGKEILFVGSKGNCFIFRVTGVDTVPQITDFILAPCSSLLSISPNGEYLAIMSYQLERDQPNDFSLIILNLADQEVIVTSPISSQGSVGMLWAPDSQSVAYNIFGSIDEDYRISIVLYDLLGTSQVLYTIKGSLFLKDWKFAQTDFFHLAEHNND